jgi:flagellar basal-body rod protein FlgB
MDLNKVPLMSEMMRRLNWLQQRQEVLAQNIANADTPGYKARDLKPQAPDSFKSILQAQQGGTTLAVTHPSHVQSARAQGRMATQVSKDEYEISPNGNAVGLEQQMMKISETQMEHQTITGLYRKQLGMLKMALGRNN